jgi:hypothetical protein
MEKQTLTVLLGELEQELLRLGYTPGSMNFYRREWKKLQLFATEKGELHYSEKLGPSAEDDGQRGLQTQSNQDDR